MATAGKAVPNTGVGSVTWYRVAGKASPTIIIETIIENTIATFS
jgi:hypothetical protein